MIEKWYMQRFKKIMKMKKNDPSNFYYKLANGPEDEALRLAEGLERQPEALAAFAEEELAPLFRHCPAGMLTMPEGEELERLLDEARYLCLDMLEGK